MLFSHPLLKLIVIALGGLFCFAIAGGFAVVIGLLVARSGRR